MSRKIINGNNVTASGPYSHAVDAGDYVFLSGQTGYNQANYDGMKLSIEDQTHSAFKNLDEVMQAGNLSYDDVIKVNVFLTSMDDFHPMNEIYKTKFNAPYPARTCVAVHQLPLEADVEIEYIIKRK
ncbi:MAG: RidA family protein [Erysipelothrix sp.]|nr:RidA family protein [Erysipelothrix sp.]